MRSDLHNSLSDLGPRKDGRGPEGWDIGAVRLLSFSRARKSLLAILEGPSSRTVSCPLHTATD